MSVNGNKKKDIQLGMSHGSATHTLRKSLLFSFAQQLDMDDCYRCGEKILTVDDFTVEHKTDWLDSPNPKELFFDLNNIAFSHVACNYRSARHRTVKTNATGYRGVSYHNEQLKRAKPYRAKITVDHKTITIGHYETAREAAIEYDKSVLEYHGDKGITNKELGLL